MIYIRSSTVGEGRTSEPGPESVVLGGCPPTVVPLKVTVSTTVLVRTVPTIIVEVTDFVGVYTSGEEGSLSTVEFEDV